jgi:hypothetical protein
MDHEDTSADAKASKPSVRRREKIGVLDIRIARDGTWFYHGSPIGRKELVSLFAAALSRRPDGSYWLETKAEEGRIQVEDSPFLAVELRSSGAGRLAKFGFRTNLDDEVPLDRDHPLRIDLGAPGAPPYLLVRNGLEARLTRAVYYQLAEIGQEEQVGEERLFGIWSNGTFFPLGRL